jgi:hypothetical protein
VPINSFELTRLDPFTFEHMVNMLALRVLGSGHTGFGAGSDGGRDGYFSGSAPYPSATENWSGRWYIQSKFMQPSLGKDPQKWLLGQIADELKEFGKRDGKRRWPDIWIVATNIEPSGVPETGAFDQALELVKKARPKLAERFHIWGGRKILDLLALHPEVAEYYAEFVSAGQVLTKLYNQCSDATADITEIIRYLIVTQLGEQQYTKLEQAGSGTDNRPGIQKLFTDIPFQAPITRTIGYAATELTRTSAQNHSAIQRAESGSEWKKWYLEPKRARVWFIKGGPGQGKSTLMQYLAQVHRAAFVLDDGGPNVTPKQRELAEDIRTIAIEANHWPTVPRIPCTIELKEFAQWYARTPETDSRRILTFLAQKLSAAIAVPVLPGTIKRAFKSSRWMFAFDGLDEVPSDVKDKVAFEVIHFADDLLVGCGTDALIVCTSRPQGYAGQFNALDAALIELPQLTAEQALACAKPVFFIDRGPEEARTFFDLLKEAISTPAIREIMTSPLQAHIMAVVVRDGGRPPERKWILYSNFYQTIKRREANRNLADKRIAQLLREEDQLIKALHSRLGFELHARAETSENAITSLNRTDLQRIVQEVVEQLKDRDVDNTVALLMEATTERLVLVNTPESSGEVRFDIRPLQEFFAAEYLYDESNINVFSDRIQSIAGDSHWREVLHFLFSGLVENNRKGELGTAVQALLQVNEGDGSDGRTLSRRLALGGLTAARLLQEGVLDQDRRVRSLFRECLKPVLGCVSAANVLRSAGPTQSAEWLFEVLCRELVEADEAESIGAALLAAILIPDHHPKCDDVRRAVLSKSTEYQLALMKMFQDEGEPENPWSYRDDEGESDGPTWLVEASYRFLAGAKWQTYGPTGVRTALSILASGSDKLNALVEEGVIPDEIVSIVKALVIGPFSGTQPEGEDEETDGFIRIEYLRPPEALNWRSWPESTWSSLRDAGGLFYAVYLALQFANDRSLSCARTLVTYLGGKPSSIGLLPDAVQEFFADELASLSLTDVGFDPNTWLRSKHPGYLRRQTFERAQFDHTSIRSIVQKNIWYVFHSISVDNDSTNILSDFVKTPDGSQLFLRALKEAPYAPLYYPEIWGRLFSIVNVGEPLRKLLVKNAASRAPEQRFNSGSAISPFFVDIPHEANLLPHILTLISREALIRELRTGARAAETITGYMTELGRQFVPDHELCNSVIDSAHVSLAGKAAALVFKLLLGTPPSNATDVAREDLLKYYNPSIGEWYVQAILAVLSDGVLRRDRWSISTASALLDASRSDYATRARTELVLAIWREMSRAPVTQASNSALWGRANH